MNYTFRQDYAMDEFKRFVEWAGGPTKAAALLDVTPGAVHHVLDGRRGVSKKMAIKVMEAGGRRFSMTKLLMGRAA